MGGAKLLYRLIQLAGCNAQYPLCQLLFSFKAKCHGSPPILAAQNLPSDCQASDFIGRRPVSAYRSPPPNDSQSMDYTKKPIPKYHFWVPR